MREEGEAILTSGNTLADGAPFYSQPFFVSTSILNMVNLVQWTSMMLMPTMLKEIQSDFDLGPEALGGVMMARELILYALSPVFGYCADTYNRRIVLAMGILAWGLAMIIAGAAKQYAELLAAMLLMGSGMAATVPVSYSLLGDYYDSADLGKAFGEKSCGVIEVLNIGADFQAELSAGAQSSATIDDFEPALCPCPANQNGNLLAAVFDAGFECFKAVAIIFGVYSCKPIKAIFGSPVINERWVKFANG